MKKKWMRALITLAAVAIVLALVWPLSFTKLLCEDEPLLICCNEYTISPEGEPGIDMHTYRLESDSPAYAQIRQILSNYSYRRCLRTFVGDQVLEGNNPGYWLQLYAGENSVILGGTGEICVNTRIHRVGMFTSGRAQKLMREVIAVLADVPEETNGANETNGGNNT